tara:strand:+ start:1581 stop:5171 length:3591 start_codon:yes stop_codon:yes gene_type:complete
MPEEEESGGIPGWMKWLAAMWAGNQLVGDPAGLSTPQLSEEQKEAFTKQSQMFDLIMGDMERRNRLSLYEDPETGNLAGPLVDAMNSAMTNVQSQQAAPRMRISAQPFDPFGEARSAQVFGPDMQSGMAPINLQIPSATGDNGDDEGTDGGEDPDLIVDEDPDLIQPVDPIDDDPITVELLDDPGGADGPQGPGDYEDPGMDFELPDVGIDGPKLDLDLDIPGDFGPGGLPDVDVPNIDGPEVDLPLDVDIPKDFGPGGVPDIDLPVLDLDPIFPLDLTTPEGFGPGGVPDIDVALPNIGLDSGNFGMPDFGDLGKVDPGFSYDLSGTGMPDFGALPEVDPPGFEYDLSGVGMPDFGDLGTPKISGPTITSGDFGMPDFGDLGISGPDITSGDFSMPDFGDLGDVDIDIPDSGDFGMPDLGIDWDVKGNIPDDFDLNVPEVMLGIDGIPDFGIDFDVTDRIPDFGDLPDLPELDLSGLPGIFAGLGIPSDSGLLEEITNALRGAGEEALSAAGDLAGFVEGYMQDKHPELWDNLTKDSGYFEGGPGDFADVGETVIADDGSIIQVGEDPLGLDEFGLTPEQATDLVQGSASTGTDIFDRDRVPGATTSVIAAVDDFLLDGAVQDWARRNGLLPPTQNRIISAEDGYAWAKQNNPDLTPEAWTNQITQMGQDIADLGGTQNYYSVRRIIEENPQSATSLIANEQGLGAAGDYFFWYADHNKEVIDSGVNDADLARIYSEGGIPALMDQVLDSRIDPDETSGAEAARRRRLSEGADVSDGSVSVDDDSQISDAGGPGDFAGAGMGFDSASPSPIAGGPSGPARIEARDNIYNRLGRDPTEEEINQEIANPGSVVAPFTKSDEPISQLEGKKLYDDTGQQSHLLRHNWNHWSMSARKNLVDDWIKSAGETHNDVTPLDFERVFGVSLRGGLNPENDWSWHPDTGLDYKQIDETLSTSDGLAVWGENSVNNPGQSDWILEKGNWESIDLKSRENMVNSWINALKDRHPNVSPWDFQRVFGVTLSDDSDAILGDSGGWGFGPGGFQYNVLKNKSDGSESQFAITGRDSDARWGQDHLLDFYYSANKVQNIPTKVLIAGAEWADSQGFSDTSIEFQEDPSGRGRHKLVNNAGQTVGHWAPNRTPPRWVKGGSGKPAPPPNFNSQADRLDRGAVRDVWADIDEKQASPPNMSNPQALRRRHVV